MKAKTKKWKFPQSVAIYKDGKVVISVLTAVYQIGIYFSVGKPNAVPDQQFGLSPAQAVKYMKQFEQSNLISGVTSEFGPIRTVIEDENGFYKQITE